MMGRVVFAGLFVGLLGVGGCAPRSTPEATMPMPGRLTQALSVVADVEAEARLAPRGGELHPSVPLTRGDDGVSFSGFIEATPGDYTLQVTFTGIPAAGGERLFLGRWTSDAFTVTAGDAAAPVFSTPLDVIGGPADAGDPDGDGLGNLDELLLGTDPTIADTDGDGLVDGLDCAPALMEATPYRIAAGGSALDCDADGARRPDVPFGAAGMDCDDRDPEVHPGATDDCSTARDEDCNPATCPVDDMDPPVIGEVTPPADAVVGCHARLTAHVTDANTVTTVTAVLVGADDGLDATLFMTADGDDFTSPPLNQVAGANGLVPGVTTVVVEATDREGNRARLERNYTLQFSLPEITQMTPSNIGAATAPVEIEIQARAAAGLQSIQLYRVAKSGQGYYDTSRAVLAGEAAQSPAQFTIDPGALEDGEHLIFAVARDVLGNEARPSAAVVPIPGTDGLEINTDYRCEASPQPPKIPARVLVVGRPGYAPSKMRDLIASAIQEAEAVDPTAQLVQIVGFGVGADGRVRLDDASSFSKRWVFGFSNPGGTRSVSVTWLTPAFPGPNPTVDPDAGNITGTIPFGDVSGLVDSDLVIDAHGAQGSCPALTGVDEDTMIYTEQDGQDVVLVSSGGQTWRGTAQAPVTELTDCQ